MKAAASCSRAKPATVYSQAQGADIAAALGPVNPDIRNVNSPGLLVQAVARTRWSSSPRRLRDPRCDAPCQAPSCAAASGPCRGSCFDSQIVQLTSLVPRGPGPEVGSETGIQIGPELSFIFGQVDSLTMSHGVASLANRRACFKFRDRVPLEETPYMARYFCDLLPSAYGRRLAFAVRVRRKTDSAMPRSRKPERVDRSSSLLSPAQPGGCRLLHNQ